MSTFDGGYIQQTFVTSEKRKLKQRDIGRKTPRNMCVYCAAAHCITRN